MGNSKEGTVWEVPAGKLTAALAKLWNELGGEGARIIARLDDDLIFRYRVAEFMLRGSLDVSTHQKRSREIMGKNFFGIEEAVKYFGVNPTRQQLAALSEIPFSEAALEELKNTHVLVADFPLSILDIRGKVKRGLFCSYDDSWYNEESFAKEKDEAGWHLVRKTPVDNSTSKSWQEQQALLSKDDKVPSAQVMVYTIIGHYLATGERLFEHIYVRCSDVVDSSGNWVFVGDFDSRGLRVNGFWDGHRDDRLGVASVRKFN